MTGNSEHAGEEMDGRLRLSVELEGLDPAEAVDLEVAGRYVVKWICGTEPEPCGEIGCGHLVEETAGGKAQVVIDTVADDNGTAFVRIELPAEPPSNTCPADASSPWRTQRETWTRVRVTNRVHGLRLAPEQISYGWTY